MRVYTKDPVNDKRSVTKEVTPYQRKGRKRFSPNPIDEGIMDHEWRQNREPIHDLYEKQIHS